MFYKSLEGIRLAGKQSARQCGFACLVHALIVTWRRHDTFGPTGPWVVTKDEIPDPQNLPLWTEVNGKRMQNGTTKTMIFGVVKLVSYVSHFITLHAGDVIATGTPPGVGQGVKPNPVFLKIGDTMRLSVEGLGVQTQRVVEG